MKEFFKGNPEPYIRLSSRRKDVSAAGAFGGISVGPEEVRKHAVTRASNFREGRNVSFENFVKFSTRGLGFILEVERFDVRVGGTEEFTSVSLRVTTIFIREKGAWKILHRLGDPLVSRIDPETYRLLARHHGKMNG